MPRRQPPKDDRIAIRLSEGLVARADALVAPMSKDTELHHIVNVTRSDVLRLAIQHGLGALERKYGRKK